MADSPSQQSAIPSLLTGVPVVLSRYVPEDAVYRIDGKIVMHGRTSHRARKRRPHGRANGPRRWKRWSVPYRPVYDRLLAASGGAER